MLTLFSLTTSAYGFARRRRKPSAARGDERTVLGEDEAGDGPVARRMTPQSAAAAMLSEMASVLARPHPFAYILAAGEGRPASRDGRLRGKLWQRRNSSVGRARHS
jgi:hypothetical protein